MTHDWRAAVTLLVCAAAGLLIIRGHRKSALPLPERGVLTLLRLAAWLDRIATAWDAAIVRYRLEMATTIIHLHSTIEREAREGRKAA